MGRSLWDARRQDEYVRQRDAAIDRSTDRREGTTVARDIDTAWTVLGADERRLLEYLVLSGARSCVGSCGDPLLSGLVDRGMLSSPPGVRPVLTDDLMTVFVVAPALWAALEARRGELFPPERDHAQLVTEAAKHFAGRLTPINSRDGPDPRPAAA